MAITFAIALRLRSATLVSESLPPSAAVISTNLVEPCFSGQGPPALSAAPAEGPRALQVAISANL